MTQADNYVTLLQGARTAAEFARALSTATNESTTEEYNAEHKLEALQYADGSRLLVDVEARAAVLAAFLVTITNPFSGASVERDISETTEAETDAYAMLLDEGTLSALEGADTPAAWLAAMVDKLGPVESGRIILGS